MNLYEPVHGNFERFCKARSYGVCDFKDLMQDTLVIAFEQFDQLKDDVAFLSFLFGITLRVHANFRRKSTTSELNDHALLQHPVVRNQAEINLERDELYEVLHQLPEQTMDCIILFEISGFSIKEIAQLQHCSEDAIKQRLSRGRKMLLTALSKQEVNALAV